MNNYGIAVIGMGATGSVIAAALLKQDPDVFCVDPRPGLEKALKTEGLTISGAIDTHVHVKHFYPRIRDLKDHHPNLIFISTKTYHLSRVLEEIKDIFTAGTKIISTHNGLGPEDLIAETFGQNSSFRMSLNFGVSIREPNHIEMAFFNRPNHIGSLVRENQDIGKQVAGWFSRSDLDTAFVDDIKLYVWKKMIYKCTLASICAVTDRTIKEVMDLPPTREIALGCFNEAIAVARAMGYDLGANFLDEALIYLEKVGAHKDSMCYDIANKLPTEIDFLGGKVVEYGQQKGVPTPYFTTMTNLVKAMEDRYLKK